MDKMLKKLDDVFVKMQNLEIQPTVTNVNILTYCYNNLQAVYNELRDAIMAKEAKQNEEDNEPQNAMTKEAKQNEEDNEPQNAMTKEAKQNAEDCAE